MIVIVPSYNDRQFLEPLLESLFTVPAGAPFRVLIVSDYSTDGTAQWLTTLKGIDVISPKEKSYFTRTCNAGLQWSIMNTDEEYLFLLNSDTVVTDSWCEALITTSIKMQAGIVGATLLNPDGTVQHVGAYGVGFHFNIDKPWIRYRADRWVPWVTGAAMMLTRQTVERVGYLPGGDQVKQYDSSDLHYCVKARTYLNIEIAVSTGCVIYHYTHQARAKRLGVDYQYWDVARYVPS